MQQAAQELQYELLYEAVETSAVAETIDDELSVTECKVSPSW
jgi:hypothetical protein